MAIIINEISVAALPAGAKVRRQPLLTAQHTQEAKVLLDGASVDAGGAHVLAIASTDLAWIQILESEAALTHAGNVNPLTRAHIVFLPPGFSGALATLAAQSGVELIHATVPDAARFDPAFVEFFVPGEYKTIRAPGAPVCPWTPTARSFSGAQPVRDIARHSCAGAASPGDV